MRMLRMSLALTIVSMTMSLRLLRTVPGGRGGGRRWRAVPLALVAMRVLLTPVLLVLAFELRALALRALPRDRPRPRLRALPLHLPRGPRWLTFGSSWGLRWRRGSSRRPSRCGSRRGRSRGGARTRVRSGARARCTRCQRARVRLLIGAFLQAFQFPSEQNMATLIQMYRREQQRLSAL